MARSALDVRARHAARRRADDRRGHRRDQGPPARWPIHTADASLAVHYEADVLITDNGPLDLTEGMSELPDIVG
ncbi:MAG: hypothetical protein R3B46_14060 [Phycisphaerales bacterium]